MPVDAFAPGACAPPHARLQVCVVLPVRNEVAGLTASLAALAAQRADDGRALDPTRFEILLLANNCDDGSAELARAFAAAHPALRLHVAQVVLPPEQANIGHVRRVLMDQACRRLARAGAPGGWIASTDGDTVVAPDWLASMAGALAAGADAVGGRIHLDPRSPIEPHALRWHRLDAALRLARSRLEDALDPDPRDPWPRHHQHFGASLGVTRQAYLQVGGVPAVRYLEDQALVDALRRHDLSLRHSPAVKVMTSAREQGRVEVGLSWQLRQWAQADAPSAAWQVESVDAWLARVLARRELRALWRALHSGGLKRAALMTGFERLAPQLHLPAPWLAAQTARAPYFGTLWAQVRASRERAPAAASVPARLALDQMRALLAAQRGRRTRAAQHVDAIGRLPVREPPLQRPARVTQAQPVLMHLVTGERVVMHRRRPVHQQQHAAGPQRIDDALGGRLQVVALPVVGHLRQHHQVQALLGELGRELLGQLHPAQRDLGQGGQPRPRLRQRGLAHVHRQQRMAARREQRGQHADGAADLQPVVEHARRQRGQRGDVFVALVGAGLESPGVGLGRVDLIEIGRRQGAQVGHA